MPDQQLEEFYIQRLDALAITHDELTQRSTELHQELSRIDAEGRGLAQALRAGSQLEPDDARIPLQFREAAATADQSERGSAGGRVIIKQSHTSDLPRMNSWPGVVRHSEMVEWCTTILQENGAPMHVGDIADALENGESRGWRIPGNRQTANVSVHLGQDPDVFVREGPKGVWALARGWNA